MARKTNNTALAIIKQSVVDVFDNPGTNYMPISQCRYQIEGITIANDEYTGSPFKNADAVTGKRISLSYNIKLRPAGGAAPPAADAYLPGLVLQAAKFTEVRQIAAVPVAAEALSAGTTTGATLGAGATGTLDLYKGRAISLSDNGADYKSRMTAIIAYTAAKVATFAETLTAPPAANYQIPKQLQYVWTPDAVSPPLISQKLWLDGYRVDLMNCRLSALQIVVPTSTKDQSAFPEIQVTWVADISGTAEETTPAIASLGAVPFYKDGDGWLNKVKVGLSTFTLDMGLQTENPPNPNKVNGSDAAELVGGTARLTMTRQSYLPSVIDPLALADAQTPVPFWAQWGNAAGNLLQIVVTGGRMNYSNPDMGGNLLMESGDLMIDPGTQVISVNMPY